MSETHPIQTVIASNEQDGPNQIPQTDLAQLLPPVTMSAKPLLPESLRKDITVMSQDEAAGYLREVANYYGITVPKAVPVVAQKTVDLQKLYLIVKELGGMKKVLERRATSVLYHRLDIDPTRCSHSLPRHYFTWLGCYEINMLPGSELTFEMIDEKLKYFANREKEKQQAKRVRNKIGSETKKGNCPHCGLFITDNVEISPRCLCQPDLMSLSFASPSSQPGTPGSRPYKRRALNDAVTPTTPAVNGSMVSAIGTPTMMDSPAIQVGPSVSDMPLQDLLKLASAQLPLAQENAKLRQMLEQTRAQLQTMRRIARVCDSCLSMPETQPQQFVFCCAHLAGRGQP